MVNSNSRFPLSPGILTTLFTTRDDSFERKSFLHAKLLITRLKELSPVTQALLWLLITWQSFNILVMRELNLHETQTYPFKQKSIITFEKEKERSTDTIVDLQLWTCGRPFGK